MGADMIIWIDGVNGVGKSGSKLVNSSDSDLSFVDDGSLRRF